MRTSFFQVLAILLGIGLCPLAGFGRENEDAKKTPFQEMADELIAGSAIQLVEYWHMPHFTSWCRLQGGDFDADAQKKYRNFPDDLIQALRNRGSADQVTAVRFLAFYTGFARSHAAQLSEKDLPVAAQRALRPHTDKIRDALVAILQGKVAKTRLMAAVALLSVDENHAKANVVLQTSANSSDAELLSETSKCIELACLTSPQAIESLRRMLKHRDPRVRHGAAGAIITIGPLARELAPDLVAFLETGKDADGDYKYPFAMALPKPGNLALMALESLKQHAKPAVPAILARFANSNHEEQVAMLACLSNIGQKDNACLTIVRQSLQSEKSNVKLAAACTLLHLAIGDREATELLKKALADDAAKTQVVEICQQFGPPSREIATAILAMLDDKSEETRINAMRALASIGPHAIEAVTGIEKLLAKQENGMTHTFLSTQAAAYALAKIRGKQAAAALLRVADSKASGARYAISYLPVLGDDLPPTTLAVLVRIVKGENRWKDAAAMTLSNLGERARPVRHDLEQLTDDPAVGWIIDTALRRIPAKLP